MGDSHPFPPSITCVDTHAHSHIHIHSTHKDVESSEIGPWAPGFSSGSATPYTCDLRSLSLGSFICEMGLLCPLLSSEVHRPDEPPPQPALIQPPPLPVEKSGRSDTWPCRECMSAFLHAAWPGTVSLSAGWMVEAHGKQQTKQPWG